MPDVAEQPTEPRLGRPMAVWTAAVGMALVLILFAGWLYRHERTVGAESSQGIEAIIDGLVSERDSLVDDGFSGVDNGFLESIESYPHMKQIVDIGPRAVPVLIEHLDDIRPTQIRSTRWGTRRVGDLCLQLLWRIVVVEDKAGCGEGLWFGPGDPAPAMRRAKEAWRTEYRRKDSLLRRKNILQMGFPYPWGP